VDGGDIAVKELNFSIRIKWYEVLLVLVECGLLLFGLWSCVDSIMIGSTVAGWRFMLLFAVWALPGAVVFFLFKPKKINAE